MCLAKGPKRSDAGEARTRGLSVSITEICSHRMKRVPTDKRQISKMLNVKAPDVTGCNVKKV